MYAVVFGHTLLSLFGILLLFFVCFLRVRFAAKYPQMLLYICRSGGYISRVPVVAKYLQRLLSQRLFLLDLSPSLSSPSLFLSLLFVCLPQRKSSPSSADSSSAVREMVWSYGFPLARYVLIRGGFDGSVKPRMRSVREACVSHPRANRIIPLVGVGVGLQHFRFRPSLWQSVTT